jgi:hypothetical protein
MESLGTTHDGDIVESRFKRRLSGRARLVIALLGLASIATVAAALNAPKSSAINRVNVAASKQYSQMITSCLDVSAEQEVPKTGSARSTERLKALNTYFIKLVQADCLRVSDSYYVNVYKSIKLDKLNAEPFLSTGYTLLQGVLYDLDYGFTPFTTAGTLCSDGWISSSAGRGTCSWHGGYAKSRGTQLTYSQLAALPDPTTGGSLGQFGMTSISRAPMAIAVDADVQSNVTCVITKDPSTTCYPKYLWARSFCSVAPSGVLYLKIEKWWVQVDKFASPASSTCSSDYPYLVDLSYASLIGGEFKLSFDSSSRHAAFDSYFEVQQR